MKFKLIRDYDTLTKRQKIAAGIVNTVIAGAIMIAANNSLGIPIVQSIRDLLITLGAGAVAIFVYAWYMKRKMKKGEIQP